MGRSRAYFVVVLGLLSAAIVSGRAQNQAPSMPVEMPMRQMDANVGKMHKPAPPAGPLVISFGEKSSTWTAATLAALPHKTVTVHDEHTKADKTYSGVALMDLLIQLGVSAAPHGKDLRLYLVATGSDGYEAVYAVAEVNPSVHDATVIVADSKNGKPLTDDGPLKLVATGEKHPARWVRNLVAIKVMTAE